MVYESLADTRAPRRAFTLAAASLALLAAAVQPAASSELDSTQSAVRTPAVNAGWDYQLGGAYPPPAGVRVVTRDAHDRPPRQAYGICYLNGFQTQPGRLRWWKHNHPQLLLHTRSGALVHDPGWPGEVLLDTSAAAKRSRLTSVVGGWERSCARKGYRAVELDNLDSFTRSGKLLTQADNLRLAAALAGTAHGVGLAYGRKNLAELGQRRSRQVGFDFAVAEDCQVYSECSKYLHVFGRHVLEIEYADNGRHNFDRACSQRGARISVLYRDRMLRPAGRRGYVYDRC